MENMIENLNEKNDPFQIQMQGSLPIESKPFFDKTIIYVKDDPRLKVIPEVNTLDDLLHMCKELELLTILMQTNIRNLIKKSNGLPAEDESPKDSLGADVPF